MTHTYAPGDLALLGDGSVVIVIRQTPKLVQGWRYWPLSRGGLPSAEVMQEALASRLRTRYPLEQIAPYSATLHDALLALDAAVMNERVRGRGALSALGDQVDAAMVRAREES